MNLSAATVNLGIVRTLLSSVTVPTTTAILSLRKDIYKHLTYLFAPRCLMILESESGGLLTLDATNLLRMVLANADSVLLTRNLKS